MKNVREPLLRSEDVPIHPLAALLRIRCKVLVENYEDICDNFLG